MPNLRLTPVLLAAVVLAGPAQARCSDRPLSQVEPMIKSFLIRPEGILERHPGGSSLMSSEIREMVSTNPTLLDPVMKLLRTASRPQRRSIGIALGSAARRCLTASDASTARRIQEAVRRQSDSELSAGFISVYAEDAAMPSLLPKADNPEALNSLGRGYIGNPDTDLFRQRGLPNPSAPVR